MYPIEEEQLLMDDIWLHNVKLYEVISESFPQLALNLWVIKIHGISDPVQLLSAVLAYLSFFKIQVDRYCSLRNSEDFGKASWSWVKSFLVLSIPLSTGFICYLITLSEDCMPAWILLVGALMAHPVRHWIVNHIKPKRSSRQHTVSSNTLMIISILGDYSMFLVSKKSTFLP